MSATPPPPHEAGTHPQWRRRLPARQTTRPAQVAAWIVAVGVVALVIPLNSALAANPFFLQAHGVPVAGWLVLSLLGIAVAWAALTGVLVLARRLLSPSAFDLTATGLMLVVSVFLLANAVAASGAFDAFPLAGWVVGAGLGVALTWLSRRAAIGVAALVIGSLVATTPLVLAIVGGAPASASEPVTFAATDDRPSILWIIADELQNPLVMDANGQVRDAFPHLQALQREATTYSDAYAAANRTELAVPAILSGVTDVAALDDDELEQLSGSLGIVPALAEEYSLVWESPVFSSACASLPCVDGSPDVAQSSVDRAGTFAADLVAVLGRTSLADPIRDSFPAIDGRWKDFWSADAPPNAVPDLLAGIEQAAAEQPDAPVFTLWHTLGTHAPWVVDDVGDQIYPSQFYAVPGAALVGRTESGYLSTPELLSFERRLYASSAADFDRQLGQLVAGLRASGRYDDTMIVLTADHGAVVAEDSAPFISGNDQRRVGDTSEQRWTEVAHVPLIVKEAGQQEARTVDDPRSVGQVASTVLEAIGAQPVGQGERTPAPPLSEALPSGPWFATIDDVVTGWAYEEFPEPPQWPAEDLSPPDPAHPFAIGIDLALLGSPPPDGWKRIDGAEVDVLPGRSRQQLLVTRRPVGECDASTRVGLVTRDDVVVGSVLWEDDGDPTAAVRGWAIVPRGAGEVGIWCIPV